MGHQFNGDSIDNRGKKNELAWYEWMPYDMLHKVACQMAHERQKEVRPSEKMEVPEEYIPDMEMELSIPRWGLLLAATLQYFTVISQIIRTGDAKDGMN